MSTSRSRSSDDDVRGDIGRDGSGHHAADHGGTVGHTVSIQVYLAVLIALFALLVATVGVAFIDLGAANIWIALAIAVVKVTLVAMFFMHLRYSGAVVTLFALAGVYWLAIMFGHTLADYFTR